MYTGPHGNSRPPHGVSYVKVNMIDAYHYFLANNNMLVVSSDLIKVKLKELSTRLLYNIILIQQGELRIPVVECTYL